MQISELTIWHRRESGAPVMQGMAQKCRKIDTHPDLPQKDREEFEMLGAVISLAKKKARMLQHCVFNLGSAWQRAYHLALLLHLHRLMERTGVLIKYSVCCPTFLVAFKTLLQRVLFKTWYSPQEASTPLILVTACWVALSRKGSRVPPTPRFYNIKAARTVAHCS